MEVGGMQRLPWPVVPEDWIIGPLYDQVDTFRAFYDAERHKIRSTLFWAHDWTLPDGIDFRATTREDCESTLKCVRLRHVPPQVTHALKIAHELEHFVLEEEGFPRTGAAPQFERLSSAL